MNEHTDSTRVTVKVTTGSLFSQMEKAAKLSRYDYKPLILLNLLVISAIVLSPFNFTVEGREETRNILALTPGNEGNWEILANVLLYLPLGFGMTGHLSSQRIGKFTTLAIVLLLCFGLSYCFEVLQSLLPSRFPSWKDVASNALGGMVGFWCMVGWKTRSLSLFLFGYLTTASLLSIPL
jgi:VanZ family protein